MSVLGKRTIREVVSRIIFDPSYDGADVDVFFVHSGDIWVVPFNFLRFEGGGFSFKGSFYPLYKIWALWDNFLGEFLLKRGDISGARRVFEVDFYGFPIDLGAIYDDLTILRHIPIVAEFLDEKFRVSGDFDWFSSLGETKVFSSDFVSLRVIMNEVYSYMVAVFYENSFFKVLPLFPSILEKDSLSRLEGSQKVMVGEFNPNNLVSCVFGKEFFCILRSFKFFSPEDFGLDRRVQVNLMNNILYLDEERCCVVGVRDLSSMRCLTPRFERVLLKKLGLRSCFRLDNMYGRRDWDWLIEYGSIRVSDWDQLFFVDSGV